MTNDHTVTALDASDLDTEVVVIGGGAAIAMRLAERHAVVVLERHEGTGRETSAHNSGVIHASIYYETGSLKHRLCWEGNALLYEWAAAHHVPHLRTGKLIVALTEHERDGLDEVEAQARANGARGIDRLTGEQARWNHTCRSSKRCGHPRRV